MINKYAAALYGALLVCLASCAGLNPNQADFALAHRDKVKFLSSFPPENRAAVLSGDGVIRIWDITNGQLVREITPDRDETAVFMIYGRHGIVVWYQKTNVLTFFPTEGFVQSTTMGKSMGGNTVRNVACSLDGKYLVYDVIDYDSTSDTDWDSNRSSTTRSTETVKTTTTRYKYSGKLHCVDVENNKWLFEISLPYTSSTNVSRSTEYEYGSGLDKDSNTSFSSYGSIVSVTSIAIDPNFGTIACGFSDGTIRLYDTKERNPQKQKKFEAHDQPVTALAFSPDGAYLLSGDERGFLRQWKKKGDPSEWSRSGQLRMHGKVLSISFSPDGKTLSIKDGSGTFRIVNFMNGKEIRAIRGGGLIDSVWFRSDNRIAALGIKGNSVFVWDLGVF
ncbi:MAG: WD40 repeat domain-containing protein [Spirochaetaceae bacterium]|jgi:WD40 repeat protein|nr:WD40 repeat domain-containing protein [Spirochaetaceae bacterium]